MKRDPIPPKPTGAALREAKVRAEPHARITLLRHGEPDWSPDDGPSVLDPGLTPFGRAQAEATAERLAQEPIDAIYVSPYRRSQETAAPLVEKSGIAAVTIDNLAEISVDVEGLSQEDVDRYFVQGSRRPLQEHWDGWPGAETFHDFHGRVTQALEATLGRHGATSKRAHDFTVWEFETRQPSIVIVAHGGTNAVAVAHLLDVQPVPWEWLRFESELAAFSVLQARPIGPKGHVWSLQNFNEVDPLKSAGLYKDARA